MKYSLILLCVFSGIQGMEEQSITTREPREWNPKEYIKGNFIQHLGALRFLNESNIILEGKTVLDAGCGTGNITAEMAKTAKKVVGIDASANMIAYAQQHFQADNVTFKQAFIEDFKTKKTFDIATLFFCFHWIQDKPKALQSLSHSLKPGGELLATVVTQPDEKTIGYTIALEMFPLVQSALSLLKEMNIFDIAGTSYPTDEEIRVMIEKVGFEILSFEKKTITHIFTDKADLENFERPILTSISLLKKLPHFVFNSLFDTYINNLITKLTTNNDGHYVYPIVTNRVIHARKVTAISQEHSTHNSGL